MILVTPEEAAEIRGWADAPPEPPRPWSHRVWSPHGGIRRVEATGRATCRACGTKIAKGDLAIVFGFDPIAGPETPLRGHVADAYVHLFAKICSEAST